MKAHQLAKALLAGPDVPVVINGWGSYEGFTFQVDAVSALGTCAYSAVGDTKDTPREESGYQTPRECVWLNHCDRTPQSDAEIAARIERVAAARFFKAANPAVYAAMYCEITPLTPEMLESMAKTEAKKSNK